MNPLIGLGGVGGAGEVGGAGPGDGAPPPAPGPSRQGNGRFGWAVLGTAAVAVLAKFKVVVIALKGLKLGKLFLTTGSMFAMILFEAQRSGWLFGVGFVLMILVHELGHGWAIKKEGLAAGYPVFIPFVGALIALRGQPRNSLVEARIAIAGPVAGTLAALVMVAAFLWTRQRLFLGLAYAGFFLNLFNLTPLSPLDGGRVAQVFSRRLWLIGIVVLGALFLMTGAVMILLVGALGIFSLFRQPAIADGAPAEAEVTPVERRQMALHYFGLCGFLAVGTYLAGQLLGSGR